VSLLGKAIAAAAGPQDRPPVPIGEAVARAMPTGTSPDERLLRAFGSNGTTHSNAGLLAEATAGPAWGLYRQQPQDGRVRYSTSSQGSDQRTEVVQHAALALLKRPNKFWSRSRLFEISQLYQELTGKCHWVLTRLPGSDLPIGIWPVRPDRMTPVPDPETYLRGWVYSTPDGRERIPLLPDEVIFNPLPDPMDPYNGTGWVQPVLDEIDAVRYAAQYNKQFFYNSARPDGVLSVDHRISDEEWDELTDRWRDAHRGVSRAHRVAVLEGVTWVPTSASAKDMDFANLMSTGGDRIRESAGMHKIMTGLVDDVNRANAQTGEEIFAAWKVAPRLRRWRDVLNYQYLPKFGATGDGVEFDFSYPSPVNREQDNLELTAKAGAFAVLVTSGCDPHDAAKIVGLPDMKMISSPPPGGLPAGMPPSPGAGELAPAGQDAGDGGQAAQAVLRLRPWDAVEMLRRNQAAWNALGAAA
jgi:HK97 family phage portal protein